MIHLLRFTVDIWISKMVIHLYQSNLYFYDTYINGIGIGIHFIANNNKKRIIKYIEIEIGIVARVAGNV